MCGICPGFAPGSVGATQHAWSVVVAGLEPLPGAPVLAQSQAGSVKLPGYLPPAEKLFGSASHSDGGYVLPRLFVLRVEARPLVCGPTGENWRR